MNFGNVVERKLHEPKERFQIVVPAAEQEFKHLWSVYKDLPWLQENGYVVKLPNRPEFLARDIAEDVETKKKLNELFISEVYSRQEYIDIAKELDGKKPLFEKVVERFQHWVAVIDFYIPENYNIILTKFGMGGGYDATYNRIVAMLSGRNPIEYRIIHEMVHIGVEKSLVRKYALTQKQKEVVVDWLCSKFLADLMPGYLVLSTGEKDLVQQLVDYSITRPWELFQKKNTST